MPGEALVGVSDLWLTAAILTLLGVHLAAVSMVVEHVRAGANFTTWRGLESNWEHKAPSETEFVREGDGLEPHLLCSIMALVLFVDLGVHRSQVLLVHVSRDKEHWVSGRVGTVRFVQRIVTNNVWVVGEAGRDIAPIIDELILDTLFIGEESTEGSHRLLCHVIPVEVLRLTFRNERIAIIVLRIVVVIEVQTDAESFVDALQGAISNPADAVIVGMEKVFSVEVGNSLTTNHTGKDVLVGIDEGVDTSLTELVDEDLDLVEVGVVVDVALALNTLPHHAEADEVLTPLDKVSDVFIVEGVLAVEGTFRGNVGIDLVHDVNSMEHYLAAVLVHESTVGSVDVNSRADVVLSVGLTREVEVWLATSAKGLESSAESGKRK